MSKTETTTLLERIAWDALDVRVAREQRNREIHSPAISLFRWWARRPHALIGEILEAAAEDGMRVSDPFSGGGTVAIEAAERGMDIYAQDLHPWATLGLATTLDGVDPVALAEAGERWLEALQEDQRALYGAEDGESEVITSFWVRVCTCSKCEQKAYLYPYPLISLASRSKHETHGFFGCNTCGSVTCSGLDVKNRRCSGCGRSLRHRDRPNFKNGIQTCANRRCGHQFAAFSPGHDWQMALVQRLRGTKATIERPKEADLDAAQVDLPEVPEPLRRDIPAGLETRRLRRAGMGRWQDLYPPRQLASMLRASSAIDELGVDRAIAARLRLIICGAAEMAGYASRWDRYYPKAFEATANHRFNLTGFAAETNLLANRGRGTLARRLTHSVKAARWAQGFESKQPQSYSSGQYSRLNRSALQRPSVVHGSSTRQLLPDESVDLVLTDPPYFDDVQYAELGALFLVWAQSSQLISRSVHVDLRSEVVPNASRGADTDRYRSLLSMVMKETKRTLKPDGRMVLTFHNTDGRAWWALARALGRAGFYVSALAVAHAENETDHAKRGRRAFSRDLIIECRSKATATAELVVASEGAGSESRELLAAGRAVAELSAALASGRLKRTWTYKRFGRIYRDRLGSAQSTYIRLGADTKVS
jgi:adenine-specific DNA methylase